MFGKSASSRFRNVHKWLGILTAGPLFFIVSTGIVLTVSSYSNWLQPKIKQSGSFSKSSTGPFLTIGELTNLASKTQELENGFSEEIVQIDVRPRQNIARVRFQNFWEIQMDLTTGQVLSSAKRWKSFLIILHDGTWFSTYVRNLVFLPTGMLTIFLILTGVFLWLFSLKMKLKK